MGSQGLRPVSGLEAAHFAAGPRASLTAGAEILAACKSLGVPVLYGGEVSWAEKTKSVYVTDPSGYTIELSDVQGGGL